MVIKKKIAFCLFFCCQFLWAQKESFFELKEVVISDTQLRDFSETQFVQKLNDSVIHKNQPALTSLLNYNTSIFFKENGLGMVSSASFRGTTAGQTAVLWNGIPINSQLTGQTDFNLINTTDFDQIAVKSGGGSVVYGSSAIGGSVHLNDEIYFGRFFDVFLKLNYGSFTTKRGHYRMQMSNENASFRIAITRNSSDNDYRYPGTDQRNENGQFYNTSINATFAYKIGERDIIKLYSTFFDSERHFPILSGNVVRTKYQDVTTRNLVEWDGFYNQFVSKLKVAFLQESYTYFPNIKNDFNTNGNVKTIVVRYDLVYDVDEKTKVNTVLDFTQNTGNGSDIESEKRQIGALALVFRRDISSRFLYEAGIRYEITNIYQSPALFSLGTKYHVTSFYHVKWNTSRNFRIPTFNDLYWYGVGNRNLKPETSYQTEVGNVFTGKHIQLDVTGYYIWIQDMLRWLPDQDLWKPQNTERVKSYGLELVFKYQKKINQHHFDINTTYAYTISKDQQTRKQLIYVPFHKVTLGFSYRYKDFTGYYQSLYNGPVFTTPANLASNRVAGHKVDNIGMDYDLGIKNTYRIGFQILNLWNKKYESVQYRPFPGRNFNVYLSLYF